MKKSIKSIIVAGFALLCFTNAQAAKHFEGVITYDIKIDNSAGTIPQEQMAMFEGSQFIVTMKENLAKVEMHMGPINSVSIVNKKDNFIVTLFDMMGKKMMNKMNFDSIRKVENAAAAEPTFKYDAETKTIAGYLCKKAEMTTIDKKSGEKLTSVVYYTEDIPATDLNTQSQLRGIKGYPLQYEVHRSGITMTMTAKSVDKKTLTDADFAIPEGYTPVTPDQMKMMGGGAH